MAAPENEKDSPMAVGVSPTWREEQEAHDREETRKWAIEVAAASSPEGTTSLAITTRAGSFVDFVYET
jgi:hypothetical protein